ncbi:MAG: nucleoside deaminase [Phycisphaerae bacterium]|nr:nucleoside deaminase [Phycisphaerae bacterium]
MSAPPLSVAERSLLDAAYEEAVTGLREGGIPIGSALMTPDGTIVARGHNLRVQAGDTTAHAEVSCIRNAGRRRDWHTLTLASTLSPCIMCTGTSLLFRIPRVIIGENRTFMGAEDLFAARGVRVSVVQDQRCIALMEKFIREHPDLWNEDIGVPRD